MKNTKKATPTNLPNNEEVIDQEDVKKLSQSLTNIIAIIEAHCTEKIEESKDLDHDWLRTEIEKLKELLSTQTGEKIISHKNTLLAAFPYDLILNKMDTDRSKKQIENVKDQLSIARGEVQHYRIYENTKPTTGLEDGPLKDFLSDFLANKQIGKNGSKIKVTEEVKKYDEANEDILLKICGIKIKGNKIIKGTKSKIINPTDKALIYFFYDKSIINKDECFTAEDLSSAEEIKKNKRYILNRITAINNAIKSVLSERTKSTNKLIVKEKDRQGYHLNPKLFTKNIKK
jgi:hypothetical protein